MHRKQLLLIDLVSSVSSSCIHTIPESQPFVSHWCIATSLFTASVSGLHIRARVDYGGREYSIAVDVKLLIPSPVLHLINHHGICLGRLPVQAPLKPHQALVNQPYFHLLDSASCFYHTERTIINQQISAKNASNAIFAKPWAKRKDPASEKGGSPFHQVAGTTVPRDHWSYHLQTHASISAVDSGPDFVCTGASSFIIAPILQHSAART
ncbi:hypothetical protein BKA67DRAFT_540936 [Truncatella angustata]|uniref:Uncharacterized protein n=1 Tax=Truncatella angustata TaxID=152316 RepID=A0A9P8RKG0_9PEZI|nr:uncharacterized protein BKA67DRAFT_540936 [Truncatella angustata]KAH6645943.1 hypothetical protein BKA67DRAFT_540936 [Truncatella angustata]